MTRVLLVDDDAAIREVTGLALESAGHSVRVAASGDEALDLLAKEPADVILLDVRMPYMDGVEFARRYHDRVTRPAPIIVLTAARDAPAEDGLRGRRYVEKPFDLDELLAAIAEVAAGGP
jgi:CheY-like chemotaxis protein